MDKRNLYFVVHHVANGIHQSIQATTDYPTKNSYNKRPILDLSVWMERLECVDGEDV